MTTENTSLKLFLYANGLSTSDKESLIQKINDYCSELKLWIDQWYKINFSPSGAIDFDSMFDDPIKEFEQKEKEFRRKYSLIFFPIIKIQQLTRQKSLRNDEFMLYIANVCDLTQLMAKDSFTDEDRDKFLKLSDKLQTLLSDVMENFMVLFDKDPRAYSKDADLYDWKDKDKDRVILRLNHGELKNYLNNSKQSEKTTTENTELKGMKHFDLNIDKILENWELQHAIRELIANAIDEAMITKTATPKIFKDEKGWWRIRDYGRGLQYHDLIQRENPEKLKNSHVIGQFGIGLKDALATFERKQVKVYIRSQHGEITLSRSTKHSFDDIVTLHASVASPTSPNMKGTECCLWGVPDSEIEAAKEMFLCFSTLQPLETTQYGQVFPRMQNMGVIFINGMKVAEESEFLFSYNITSLNTAIKQALNRERQNLGRSAYSDRVRSILLACKSENVVRPLADDLESLSQGNAHDELSWRDVQQYAAKILNSLRNVVFMSSSESISHPHLIDKARSSGLQVVTVPETLTRKICGISDVFGQPVRELNQLVKQYNEGFQFDWVLPDNLSPQERAVWDQCNFILQMMGGRPSVVKDIRISRTMRSDPNVGSETLGLWDSNEGWIIIKRSELQNLAKFAGTLLHEAIHAKFGLPDVSRDFESRLTVLAGDLAARVIELTHTQQEGGR